MAISGRLYQRRVIFAIEIDGQRTKALIVDTFRGDGLRIDFNLGMFANNPYQHGRVQLYNLSDESRQAITQTVSVKEPRARATLQAGYGDREPPYIFLGFVRSVVHEWDGQEIITDLLLGPVSALHQTVELSLEQDLGLLPIIQGMLKKVNLPSANIAPALVNLPKVTKGTTIDAKFVEAMGELLPDDKVYWFVDHSGTFHCRELDDPLEDRTVVFIAETTGMIGAPEITIGSDTEIAEAVRVQTLLDPRVNLLSPIAIRSRKLSTSARWRPTAVRNQGSTEGADFTTRITASAI